MVCLTCGRLGPATVCELCRASLRPAGDRFLPGVGLVRAAFLHHGPARLLVHHLKYRGVVAAGRVLAEAMAPHVPAGTVLVPVTRLGWRRLRYGVDPARELSTALARLTGSTVASLLVAPFFGKARAGGAHGFAPSFRRRGPGNGLSVTLVDDVVTTGTTLMAAAALLPNVEGALAATSSLRQVDPLGPWAPGPDGGHGWQYRID